MTHTSIINDYIAGAIGGCAGIIAGHPLDTIKVQIQTQEYGGKYTGLMDCIRTVHRQNLSKGYFRGLSWPLFSYGYLNAIFFGSYGLLLRKLGHSEDTTQKPNYLIIWFSSAVATLPQLVFACPVEVVKVTLQAQIPHTHDLPKMQMSKYYKGPIEAAVSIVQKAGLRGIYRGLLAHMLREIPANSIYMVLYVMFQYESQHWLPSIPSQVINFFGGGIAGVMSWVATMPFDVVKSKLQADAEGRMYKGFWDCARRVYAAEGGRVFFLGMVPTAMRAFPVNAVTLMVYTESLLYLKKLERSLPKMQMSKYYKGPIEAAVNIVQKAGLRGIYRGLPTHILRDIPANCIYMVLYVMFQYESQHWLPSIPSQVINFFGGGIAGVLSWVAIMPFDVVKSKLQADAEGRMYKGFWDCAWRVYAAEGGRGFFLGMAPMAMRAFPVNAVTLMVYTESLLYLKKLERSRD